MIGKVEGVRDDEDIRDWHGHVSAVTVAPQFRRQGLATALMDYLEDVTDKIHNAFFVDLFVRPSNKVAVKMYENLGYIVFRTVEGYYNDEDAYDMRKAMPRDKDKKSLVAFKKRIKPHELEYH